MRRMRSFRRGSAPRRKYAWGGARLGGTVELSDNDVGAFWIRVPASALDTTFTPPQFVDVDNTLIRTRAVLAISTNNGGTQLNQSHNFACGIIAWDGLTDNPLDAGLLPHPALELSLDWIWRWASPTVVDNIFTDVNSSTIDAYQSQAQRKLSSGTGLLFVYGFHSFTGAPASLITTIALDCRYLVKLP